MTKGYNKSIILFIRNKLYIFWDLHLNLSFLNFLLREWLHFSMPVSKLHYFLFESTKHEHFLISPFDQTNQTSDETNHN